MMAHTPQSADDQALARFEEFFRLNYVRVAQYVARRVSAGHVDDVISSTFIVAWKKFATADDPSLPWLFRIASYEVNNHRRALRRVNAVVSTDVVDDLTLASNTNEFDVTEVVAALDRLSRRDREILQLVHWDGLSRADAATTLRLSTNAVNVRYHRALRRLQDHMPPATIYQLTSSPETSERTSPSIKGVLP